MSKSKKSVKVKAIKGEPLCYLVESWGEPDKPHKVDLAYHDGLGFCDCWDFLKRCSDNRKRLPVGAVIRYGTPDNKNPSRTMCRHIQIAMDKWTKDTLRDISRKLRQG